MRYCTVCSIDLLYVACSTAYCMPVAEQDDLRLTQPKINGTRVQMCKDSMRVAASWGGKERSPYLHCSKDTDALHWYGTVSLSTQISGEWTLYHRCLTSTCPESLSSWYEGSTVL